MELTEVFGSNVFNDKVMKERLPKEIYKALKETIEKDMPLRPDVADVVANAMKDWAIEKGATHYTHWFQPLTGITAEKHDSFISPSCRRQRIPGVFRQAADPGRAGCIVFPERRSAQHLRSERLYCLGLHLSCLPERQMKAATSPSRFPRPSILTTAKPSTRRPPCCGP